MIKDRARWLEQLITAEDEMAALEIASTIVREYPSDSGQMYHLFAADNSLLEVGGRGVPLLIAHLDTVRRDPVPGVSCGPGGLWIAEDGGVLGADDRAGIAVACWTHLMTGWPILLTDGEEVGGIGAHELVESLTAKEAAELCCVKRFSCLVQLDRRGCGELVWYDRPGEKLANSLSKKFTGWRVGSGSYTDIATICPEWGIAGFNVAVGYFGEHFAGESLAASYCAALPETLTEMGPALRAATRPKKRDFDSLSMSAWGGGYSLNRGFAYDDQYIPPKRSRRR